MRACNLQPGPVSLNNVRLRAAATTVAMPHLRALHAAANNRRIAG